MSSKQQDLAPSISPVLFMTVDSEPMNFFLRPGPVKQKLQPLVTAGGGVMCRIQQPGAILLIDPKEKSSVPESAAHWYVSTQYILDCIEQEEQLNLEDYRFSPKVVQRHSPRLNRSKGSAATLSSGRLAYTPEEDADILTFVSKHQLNTGGNRCWQEMEKQHVTSRSWQSMKARYKKLLTTKQSGIEEVEIREDANKTKVGANQEHDAENSFSEEDVPQKHSADSNSTQIELQSEPAGCTPENKDAQTTDLIRVEEKQNQESDKQADENLESETVEVEACQSSQTERENVEPVTPSRTAETTEPERDEPETTVSPQKQNLPEDSSAVQSKSTPQKSSSKILTETLDDSPRLEQPQRRITRRQLELDPFFSSPEPYAKKLRSSSSCTERSTSSPQISKKTKSPLKSVHQDNITDPPPPKRARGKKVASEAESQPEQSGQDTNSKMPQAGESNSVPQKAEKKREKRKLGILELATKEFEDDSESDEDEDETPDLQKDSETAATLTESQPKPSDTTPELTSAQSNPETGPHPQENLPESQALSADCIPDTHLPDAAPAVPAASEPAGANTKAHLFIFDSESQEEDSQSVYADCLAAPSNSQPTLDKGAAFSLTQAQLEEDKQRIRDLMNQTNQDLISVTKALLKTSGDVSAALNLLLNPSSVSVRIWTHHDDSCLLSSDPAVRQKLQEKYGEENVAKRIVFLEVEG